LTAQYYIPNLCELIIIIHNLLAFTAGGEVWA
jgi:hypothetical protein